jgi:NAD(P)-dependent dehydrogenase (short-subunit alcohol dehydrogenase family)
MAYAASKAAQDKFVRETAIRLKGTGVTMNLLDPGCPTARPFTTSRPRSSAGFACLEMRQRHRRSGRGM